MSKTLFLSHRRYLIPIVSGMIGLLILSGCATNPATRRTEFMLVSEQKEFEIGKQVDKQVREEMGIYLDLPDLRNRVKQVVEELGRASDRPDVIYRLEIIDRPDFNAFAVPGGFVYIHRGLLERINSLDELASVMGHEIAHVAARHSAAQISKMQILNLGLLGISIATGGEIQDYSSLIDLGAILTFSKFSRDDEREADYLGVRYMTDAGYNPRASIDVMEQIRRLHDREPGSLEIWFMTHPPTSERLVNLEQELDNISRMDPAPLKRVIRRNDYIRLLEGMVVGQWNGKELVSGENYINKEFFLSLPVPSGWQAQIDHKEYTAVFFDLKKESFAYFNVQPLRKHKTSRQYFDELSGTLRNKGLLEVSGEQEEGELSHGALSGIFQGRSSKLGPVKAHLSAFTRGDKGYYIFGLGKEEGFNELQNLFESMVKGLRFIPEDEASKISPPLMRIHEVSAGETWEGIALRYYKSSTDKTKLAEYNGLDADKEPAPGILLKIPPSLRL